MVGVKTRWRLKRDVAAMAASSRRADSTRDIISPWECMPLIAARQQALASREEAQHTGVHSGTNQKRAL